MSVFGWMAAIGLGSVAVVLIYDLWGRDWWAGLWRDVWADAGKVWWGM